MSEFSIHIRWVAIVQRLYPTTSLHSNGPESTCADPPSYLGLVGHTLYRLSHLRNISLSTTLYAQRVSALKAVLLAGSSETSALQPGSQQIAAAYALYSSATMIVITLGQGTYGFTLDRQSATFYLTHSMKIPMRGISGTLMMVVVQIWQGIASNMTWSQSPGSFVCRIAWQFLQHMIDSGSYTY